MPRFAAACAALRPDEIAIRDERRALDWARLDDALNRVANGLNALSFGPDRRIAVFSENAIETSLANLGGLIAGASVVPVNFHLTAAETAYILQDSEATVLYVDGATATRGVQAARMASVNIIIGWDADHREIINFADWMAASFSDPVVAFGVNGVEYFGHPWEFGARKAKEMLFTGGVMSAREARSLGMVNHVVPREELEEFTMSIAERISSRPTVGLRLAKQSVNQAQDAQGLWTALQSAMSLQQLGHSNNAELFGRTINPSGVGVIRSDAKGDAWDVG
tara:strand:+ start:1266 stop:2108 length:843 start_codon:yes stop_codon:yes gene_type:complete